MLEGYVKKILIDKHCGFIAAPGQPDAFFHKSELSDGLEFNNQLQERRVRFRVIGSDKGPRAVGIVPA